MSKELKFKFLKDAPLGNKQGVIEFYHKIVAPALQEILENESCVHTIGLFSKWGTGKSTVIEMIRNDLKFPMFVFDAWKYQEDSLRRIFLLEFVNFISIQEKQDKLKVNKEEFEIVKDKINSVLYKNTEVKKVEPKKSNNSESWREKISKNKKFLFLVLLLILVPVLVFLGEKYLNINQVVTSIVNYFAGFSLLVVVLSKICIPLLTNFFKDLLDKITKSIFPVAEIRETIEREERLNSPEQFEKLFREIIDSIESDKKVIIVFDNIDRVQGDTAIKILSTIKTFLDPKDIVGLTFIVPCDSDAINNQIQSFYKGGDDNFDPSEYLRKLFNVIIWMPEFIEADLHLFITKIIEETGEIKKLLQQEDVVFVIRSAFSNNPREIKQFINNLISALVIASKTEVWDRIKKNTPYLAKILFLKQKFPKAYLRLKHKWFEPENILDDEDDEDLQNFMLNTSRITVDNVEPFIYFKEPSISTKLTDSVDLIRAFVDNNNEKAKEIIKKEKNREAVVEFVEHLLRKYRSQKELLKNIFVTHLEIFNELNLTTSKSVYYDTLARTLDGELWQFYAGLPTNLIFSILLSKKELDVNLRKLLVDRYKLALDSEETRKPDKMELVQDILINFMQNDSLLGIDDRLHISKSIDEHFSTEYKIISLFKNLTEQERFITQQAFDKFVKNINDSTFLRDKNVLLQYKEFIIKNNKLGSLIEKITELIQEETVKSPDYRPEKETFMNTCSEIFSEFQDELENIDDGVRIQLIEKFTQAFNSIGDWNNRTPFVNNLRWLSFSAPNPQKEQIDSLINTYFQQATTSKVEVVLDYWEKETMKQFIDDYFPFLLQRSIQDEVFLDVVYKRADKSKKIELITNLINQKGVSGLNFLRNLGDKLPDRQAVIRHLLNKTSSMPLDEQILIYDYLPSHISKNDPIDLKDQIINIIKELLKSDNLDSQEAGHNLLLKTKSLSDTKKREIGKEIIKWLRLPDKALNSNHKFVLKSVASLIPIMQETPINDFIYILFDMLKQGKDEPTVQASLEKLDELKPKV